MPRTIYLLIFLIGIFACKSPEAQKSSLQGLKKIHYTSEEEISQLKQAGAEIIVKEKDYVIVRGDKMIQTLSLKFEPIAETDLVQRLVHIHIKDKDDLQTVVDTGVDFWQVKGDTAIGRAFDIQIEKIRAAGLTVKVVAMDAAKKEGTK